MSVPFFSEGTRGSGCDWASALNRTAEQQKQCWSESLHRLTDDVASDHYLPRFYVRFLPFLCALLIVESWGCRFQRALRVFYSFLYISFLITSRRPERAGSDGSTRADLTDYGFEPSPCGGHHSALFIWFDPILRARFRIGHIFGDSPRYPGKR